MLRYLWHMLVCWFVNVLFEIFVTLRLSVSLGEFCLPGEFLHNTGTQVMGGSGVVVTVRESPDLTQTHQESNDTAWATPPHCPHLLCHVFGFFFLKWCCHTIQLCCAFVSQHLKKNKRPCIRCSCFSRERKLRVVEAFVAETVTSSQTVLWCAPHICFKMNNYERHMKYNLVGTETLKSERTLKDDENPRS